MLVSGIIAAKQVHVNKYMSTAQKSIESNTKGSKHQLLIDGAVTNDSRSRQTNLSTAWIDYRKAYNSIPHTDLGMPGTIQCQHNTFIKNLIELWKTTLEVHSRSVTHVNIESGIYQGDALSPLLFCIGLNPLSQIITKSRYGNKFKSGANISHLRTGH